MAVAPFEQTCTACHLDQIIGKERVSGPKGVAFLTLPGLDLRTLKEKNALIGEWPDASEAELTPFMKVMISRNERGRALIKTVDSLNLQDLTDASDDQIKAVTNSGLGDQGAVLCADLGKSVGRPGRPQYWQRGEAECESRCRSDREHPARCGHQCATAVATQSRHGNGQSRSTGGQNQSGWSTAITVAGSPSPEEPSGSDAQEAARSASPEAAVSEAASTAKLDPPVCTVRIFGQCLLSKGAAEAEAAEKAKPRAARPMAVRKPCPTKNRLAQPSLKERPQQPIPRTPRPMAARKRSPPTNSLAPAEPEGAAATTDTANAKADGGEEAVAADEQPRPAQPEGAAATTDTANAKADGGEETLSADEPPQNKAADQTDDLLSPTEDELRAMKAAEKAAQPEGAAGDAPADSDTAAAEPQTGLCP